jgi:FKBP-type peptidyl-prolyl cis-trans isomerase SlyD
MKLSKDTVVSLIYSLHESAEGGRELETVNESAPLTFIYGAGRLLPAFEANLAGLETGSDFDFNLNAADAYGEKREEMIVNLPRNIFEDEGKLNTEVCFVGNTVPMMDAHGNRMVGTVTEIGDSFVAMDFNHPLAGVDLHFSGKIIDVRNATSQELEALQSEGGCSSCGSKSSGCSGSCS